MTVTFTVRPNEFYWAKCCYWGLLGAKRKLFCTNQSLFPEVFSGFSAWVASQVGQVDAVCYPIWYCTSVRCFEKKMNSLDTGKLSDSVGKGKIFFKRCFFVKLGCFRKSDKIFGWAIQLCFMTASSCGTREVLHPLGKQHTKDFWWWVLKLCFDWALVSYFPSLHCLQWSTCLWSYTKLFIFLSLTLAVSCLRNNIRRRHALWSLPSPGANCVGLYSVCRLPFLLIFLVINPVIPRSSLFLFCIFSLMYFFSILPCFGGKVNTLVEVAVHGIMALLACCSPWHHGRVMLFLRRVEDCCHNKRTYNLRTVVLIKQLTRSFCAFSCHKQGSAPFVLQNTICYEGQGDQMS